MKNVFLSFVLFGVLAHVTAQNTSPYWSLAGNSNASNSSSKLGTTNTVNLRIFTKNLERVRVDTSGRVGIGTTTPDSRLTINTTTKGQNALRAQVNGSTKLLVDDGGGVSVGSSSTPPANGLYVVGNVGIGTTSPLQKLHVNGNQVLAGNLNFTTGLQSIQFANPGASSNAMMYMFASGTTNYPRMIISHSPGFPTWGLQYTDNGDQFDFLGAGTSRLSVNLSNGNVGIGEAAPTYRLQVNGSVYVTGTYNGSDRKLKQNITDLTSAMDIINKLQPKVYEFRRDASLKPLNLPEGKHYGLIAQDLEQVLPTLVKNTPFHVQTEKPKDGNNTTAEQNAAVTDFKAVNYTELIPILIKAMQELNAEKDKRINDLQTQVNELKSLILKGQHSTSVSSVNGFLKQNVPNPVNGNTVISYYIPGNAGYAQIEITDAEGRLIKTFNAAKGEGQVNIKSGELPAGTYNYTLYVNNKVADTKQMILVK